jgi:hypothetical protein
MQTNTMNANIVNENQKPSQPQLIFHKTKKGREKFVFNFFALWSLSKCKDYDRADNYDCNDYADYTW